MRAASGVGDDGENIEDEDGELWDHRGGRGTKAEEQMLRKIFWPTSSLVLTVNL